MVIKINNFKGNTAGFLRSAGYVYQKKEGDEMAFVRPLARSGFPRFHIFASVCGGDLILNLHIDQKKATYGSSRRHHGEYKNEGLLKEEFERIKEVFAV